MLDDTMIAERMFRAFDRNKDREVRCHIHKSAFAKRYSQEELLLNFLAVSSVRLCGCQPLLQPRPPNLAHRFSLWVDCEFLLCTLRVFQLSFTEFATALGVMMRGTDDQKLDLSFRILNPT